MNKTAIKNFSIWARNKLIDDIRYHAGLVGVTEEGIKEILPQSTKDTEFYDIGTGSPYAISGESVRQRKKLVEVIRAKERDTNYPTAYKYILEEVAYTWFNRLIAIRFMEVNDYLPSHVRVLSSDSGKLEPDLATDPFQSDLDFSAEEEQTILKLKQDNEIDQLFRLLFIKQCNALNGLLPGLFEKTADYTELLLNVSVVDRDGVIYHLTHDIEEKDFNVSTLDENGNPTGQVEIIGWLYQYWNTEPKDAVFSRPSGQKIRKEEIPAATQLFTPDWIVRYMVENSLGRLWVEGHPDGGLKANWKYYLEEAEQEPKVQKQLEEIRREYASLNPEDLRCIDPCMGSGHILCYLFDVLMQIYESQGWSRRDAAQSILKNNLYGLDIDERAYQLAYFAVMMKARQYDRHILTRGIQPHVYAVCESNGISPHAVEYFINGDPTLKGAMDSILTEMRDAMEYGSLVHVTPVDFPALYRRFDEVADDISMFQEPVLNGLLPLVRVAEILAQKYHAVVTNPPYMAVSNGNAKLQDFVKKNFPDSKADLFAVFIERCGQFTEKNCYQAMITQHAWMFLSSFEKLRAKLQTVDTVNMAHLGARAFDEISGEVVQTTSFVIRKNHTPDYLGRYQRLIDGMNEAEKAAMFCDERHCHTAKQSNFSKIPGSPVAYWVSEKIYKTYEYPPVGNTIIPRHGLATSDNNRFLKLWFEININKGSMIQKCDYSKKWFPMNKGGSYRKWYGNLEWVINYENDGKEIKDFAIQLYKSSSRTIQNTQFYFHESITWSALTSGSLSFRWSDVGAIFGSGAHCAFAQNSETLLYGLALLNGKVSAAYLHIVSPTLNTNVDDIRATPYIEKEKDMVVKLVRSCISLSKSDWDSFETSWDFICHPLVCDESTIQVAFAAWEQECENRFQNLRANEEELNRIFIDIYGLQDELTPEVEDKDVTVRRANLQRDIKSLISYAVGCMFGRYSLDTDGLAYAGGEWDDSKYRTYIPDADNILPITDEEYFDDDIVGLFCAWLKKAYGADTLEQNLDFIAKALGNKGNTSREVIRNYFLNGFFTDHCKIYQKRPIYWLFDSGKQNGFKALVYLHRYTPDTIGNLRVDYLHRMQRIYDSEINRMQDTIDHSKNSREVAAATKRKEKLQRQLKECREYDEKVSHLALARIDLDLDDGVKANYRKAQTAADGKFYEVLADSKNIMGKK